LLRTIDLGVDVGEALLLSQFRVIAGWRDRSEDCVVRTCRQEAIRLPKRIVAVDGELIDNRKTLDFAVAGTAPELCELPGVGAVVAASLLTAWSHPGRVRFEAAFAALAGTCPIPASSEKPYDTGSIAAGQAPQPGTDHRSDRPHAHLPTKAYVARRRAEGRTRVGDTPTCQTAENRLIPQHRSTGRQRQP
jgi:transposase